MIQIDGIYLPLDRSRVLLVQSIEAIHPGSGHKTHRSILAVASDRLMPRCNLELLCTCRCHWKGVHQ